jgi:hypothetical protein
MLAANVRVHKRSFALGAGAAQNSRYASKGLLVRPFAGIFSEKTAENLEKCDFDAPVLDRTRRNISIKSIYYENISIPE